MALTQISYIDKVGTSYTPAEEYCNKEDMNEIKSVTNGVIDSLEGIEIKIGANAGATGQSGGSVAIGNNAGNSTQGGSSVAVGANAGQTTQGDNSVAIGVQAGQNATGNFNTLVGRFAGQNATGQQNTCIGNKAGDTLTTENNTTCLGDNAQVTASAQIQLGSSITTTYAYGPVQDRSDLRDKADVQNVHLGLDFIDALTPRSYKFDYREDYREHTEDEEGNLIPDTRTMGELEHDGTHKRTRLHCGLVAQEVKQVMDDLGVDFAGYQDHKLAGGQDVLSIGYGELISPMIKAIQELKAEIELLKQA